jgi:HEAT repeat protein
MPLIRRDADQATTPEASASGLQSASSDARWSAARQLAKDPSSAATLGKALAAETEPRVREAIFTSLAHIRSPDAVAAILPYIRSPDAAIRAGALDALSAMPDAVESHLPALLADPDPDVRLLVCEIVRKLPSPVATRHLCALLEGESLANVAGAAVEVLSEVGDETALPALAKCADCFAAEPFLVFSIQAARRRITGDGRAV